jgi:hypothetical protein
MATVTITGAASVTLDGRTISKSASFIAEVDDIIEQTVEVETTYVTIGPGATPSATFILIVNDGANDAYVRFTISARYKRFGIPAGGHLLIPCGMRDETELAYGTPASLAVRASTGTTRIYVMTGKHE